MYKKPIYENTTLKVNESVIGEPLEHKLERVVNNGEGVEDGSPSIYTERSQGVLSGYDIRADKWDIALDAMNGIHKLDLETRQKGIDARKEALEAMKKKQQEQQENSENSGDQSQ